MFPLKVFSKVRANIHSSYFLFKLLKFPCNCWNTVTVFLSILPNSSMLASVFDVENLPMSGLSIITSLSSILKSLEPCKILNLIFTRNFTLQADPLKHLTFLWRIADARPPHTKGVIEPTLHCLVLTQFPIFTRKKALLQFKRHTAF